GAVAELDLRRDVRVPDEGPVERDEREAVEVDVVRVVTELPGILALLEAEAVVRRDVGELEAPDHVEVALAPDDLAAARERLHRRRVAEEEIQHRARHPDEAEPAADAEGRRRLGGLALDLLGLELSLRQLLGGRAGRRLALLTERSRRDEQRG